MHHEMKEGVDFWCIFAPKTFLMSYEDFIQACSRSFKIFSFLRNFVQKTIFFMSYFSHENLHTNEVNLFILLQEKLMKKEKKVGKGGKVGKSHKTWYGTGMTKMTTYSKIWPQMRMSPMFFGPRLFPRKSLK